MDLRRGQGLGETGGSVRMRKPDVMNYSDDQWKRIFKDNRGDATPLKQNEVFCVKCLGKMDLLHTEDCSTCPHDGECYDLSFGPYLRDEKRGALVTLTK